MDRRYEAAAPSGPGVILLGQVAVPLPAIDMACERCDGRGPFVSVVAHD